MNEYLFGFETLVEMLASFLHNTLGVPAMLLNWWVLAVVTLLVNLMPLIAFPAMFSNMLTGWNQSKQQANQTNNGEFQ